MHPVDNKDWKHKGDLIDDKFNVISDMGDDFVDDSDEDEEIEGRPSDEEVHNWAPLCVCVCVRFTGARKLSCSRRYVFGRRYVFFYPVEGVTLSLVTLLFPLLLLLFSAAPSSSCLFFLRMATQRPKTWWCLNPNPKPPNQNQKGQRLPNLPLKKPLKLLVEQGAWLKLFTNSGNTPRIGRGLWLAGTVRR